MSTFQDYLKFSDNEEYSQKQLKIIDKITLSEETEKAVKSINKEIKILCLAQVYCPDCRAIVPFMKKKIICRYFYWNFLMLYKKR